MVTKDLLQKEGYNPSIYTFPTLKPIDCELILNCSKTHQLIVTVEEHNRIGELGSAVSEVIAESEGLRANVLRIGLDNRNSSVVGNQKYLRDIYDMSAMKIVNKIRA